MDNNQNQQTATSLQPSPSTFAKATADKQEGRGRQQTPESPYTPILEKLGLNKNEAQIYELLIQTGPQSMKPILFHTKLKRGNAYYHLDNLTAKGLVEKQDLPGQTTKFIAKNPEQLHLLVSKQKAAVFSAEEELNKNLPQLRSLYQLAAIRPTVKYFEGLDGAKQIVEDTLISQTEVYSYTDLEIVNKYYSEFNQGYVEQRLQKNLKKRMIVADSLYNREHAKTLITPNAKIRILSAPTSFAAIMYIYDNKVSYITLHPNKMVSTIIEHEALYRMHKTLFESHWQTAKIVV
jgi:sugar-specific transcriptional regulator TrmB